MPFNTKEKWAKYIKDYNHKKVAKGLCIQCGKLRGNDGSKWLCRACQNKWNAASRAYTQKLKTEVILHYGGKCTCCGEATLGFLTIDHVNNDGNKQRHTTHPWGGRRFYMWLRKNNYPAGYQVQCFNCNLGRSINGGICPHEEMRKSKALTL
jgi:hypothetical protein